MSTLRLMTTTLASGALLLGGVAGATPAHAQQCDNPDGGAVEIEALQWPEYALGDEDTDITVAAYLLANWDILPDDYELPNDEFTEELEDAVLEWQGMAQFDLPETGELDPETWDSLRKNNYGDSAEQGDSGERVYAVQYSLINDYDKDIAFDGQFGPETEEAVTEAQDELGVCPDDDTAGTVDIVTFRALVTGGV